MKRILVLLLLAVSGVSYGMENAIAKSDWSAVVKFLGTADKAALDGHVRVLVTSKVDLNTFDKDNRSLLQYLLRNCEHMDKPQAPNLRVALKELLRHDKLNPNLVWSDQSVVTQMDALQQKKDGIMPYTPLLKTLCDEVYAEDVKQPWYFTTVFHGKEATLATPFKRRAQLTWHPLCMLVDYRVWAAAAAFICLSAWYTYTSDKSQEADENEETAQNEQDAQQKVQETA